MALRVVGITGSRAWRWPDWIHAAMCRRAYEWLFVGDCPTGADAIAIARAKVVGMPFQKFDAHWERYPDRKPNPAGPIRNQEMVDRAVRWRFESGAVFDWYAFPEQRSAGTWDCVKRLRKAGFAVTIMRYGERPERLS